jgi:hypothetical protein
MPIAKYLAAAAFMLSATSAFAQTAPAPEVPPVADKGTTSQLNCIADNNRDVGKGNNSIYRIEMSNKCEQRLKCAVFAYAITAKGPSQGRATLVLAPKSQGAAPQFYDFKIKGTGGMTTTSRECRVI